MFKKILIANRGEIALRIIRTCKEMGIKTVAIYSDVDAESLHVKMADEAYLIGNVEDEGCYLNSDKILDIAQKSMAEAIHPGYGFLAENLIFVRKCEQRGLTFIGPPSQSMRKVKPKHTARHLMRLLNIPIVLGYNNNLIDSTNERLYEIEAIADKIGYPILVKPSGGGGGIGMVVAKNRSELDSAIEIVERRGRKIFGVSEFYIEKLLNHIKHIEFQVIADKYGNAVLLGERDCSIQRRFQKVIEEAPCHILSPRLRMKMGAAALDIALAMKYVNAMTVEFFYVPETQEFFFNEVNTRLQVEHCVTELVTNIDIVKEQITIAAGEPLSINQDDVNRKAWAIECRIAAEDVSHNFLPSPGQITYLHLPQGIGLRIDEGIYQGCTVSPYYESLLLKLMTWGNSRDEAISRMKRAVGEMKIEGIKTNLPLHRIALEDSLFISGQYCTDFIEKQQLIKRVREEERSPSS